MKIVTSNVCHKISGKKRWEIWSLIPEYVLPLWGVHGNETSYSKLDGPPYFDLMVCLILLIPVLWFMRGRTVGKKLLHNS